MRQNVSSGRKSEKLEVFRIPQQLTSLFYDGIISNEFFFNANVNT